MQRSYRDKIEIPLFLVLISYRYYMNRAYYKCLFVFESAQAACSWFNLSADTVAYLGFALAVKVE